MKILILKSVTLLFFVFTLLYKGGAQNQVGLSYRQCNICEALNSEDNPSNYVNAYQAPQPYTADDVASDFGPRSRNGYEWHTGVDFSTETGNGDLGNQILSINSGNVARIWGEDFKRVQIDGDNGHDYAYGHLFRATTQHGDNLGNMVWFIRPNGRVVIIFVGENRAIGETNTPVTFDGITYDPVRTHVNAGEAIGPLGDSDALNYAHVHLYEIPATDPPTTNWGGSWNYLFINPLQNLIFPQPSHNLQLLHPNNNTTGILLHYNKTKTSIRLRDTYSSLPPTLFIPDADLVKYLIREDGVPYSNYQKIKGNSDDGEINYGGGWYRSLKTPESILNTGTAFRGSETLTGVYPHYNPEIPGNPPYFEDFYFSDFYTRIHKNDAKASDVNLSGRSKDARYPDGNYNIRVQTRTLRGLPLGGAFIDEDITLDNFWPYVEGINVYFDNGKEVYSSNYYGCNNVDCTELKFIEKVENKYSINASSGKVEINVLVSEPLLFTTPKSNSIKCRLWDPSGTLHINNDAKPVDDNRGQLWKITFNNLPYQYSGEYRLEFYDAQDKAGHDLLNFDQWGSGNTIEQVPHKLTETQWWPSDGNPQEFSGQSRIYKFKLKPSCSIFGGNLKSETHLASFVNSNPTNTCDCEPLADFTYQQQTGSPTLDFDAAFSTGTAPLTYAWDYGDGSSGSGKTSAHSYAEGGDYLVKLTVTDPCDGSAAAEKWITVMEAGGSSLEVDIEGPTMALKGQEVAFHALVPAAVCRRTRFAGAPPPATRSRCRGPGTYAALTKQAFVFHQRRPRPRFQPFPGTRGTSWHKMAHNDTR